MRRGRSERSGLFLPKIPVRHSDPPTVRHHPSPIHYPSPAFQTPRCPTQSTVQPTLHPDSPSPAYHHSAPSSIYSHQPSGFSPQIESHPLPGPPPFQPGLPSGIPPSVRQSFPITTLPASPSRQPLYISPPPACRPSHPIPQPAPKSPVRSPLYISAACVHRLTPGQPSHQVSAPRQPCIRAHCHPGSPVIPSTPFPQPTPKSPVRSPLYIPARRLHPSADRPGQPSHQLPTPIPTTRAPPSVPTAFRIPQSPFPLLQPPSKFRSLDRPPNPSRHSARNGPKIPPFLSLTPHSTPPSPKSSRSRHLPPPTCPTIPPPTGPKIRQNPIISV